MNISKNNKKFALFLDSGQGGLSILDYYLKSNEFANVIYFGDTAHFPYGKKHRDELFQYIKSIYDNLKKEFDIAIVVLACNTASVSVLDLLREYIKIPIIGTVPPIKVAAEITKNNKIGVIATETTVELDYLSNLIDEFAKDKEVYMKASNPLVKIVEENSPDNEKDRIIEQELKTLKEEGIDTLVLGCTHYSLIKERIEKYFDNKINVIDPRDGVSKRIKSISDDSINSTIPERILFLSDESSLDKYKKINDKLKIFNKIMVRYID